MTDDRVRVREPEWIDHDGFTIVGLRIRTSNADEADPAAARLPALWGAYFAGGGSVQIASSRPHEPTFGVYTAYDSDHRGAYDVLVGASAPREAPLPGPDWARHDVPAGRYLVFRGEGPMPAAVIEGWSAVWRYFEARPSARRAYMTDFELYDPALPGEVAIYIGATPVAPRSV